MLFVFAVVSKRLCDARPVVQVFGIASWGINNDWKSTGVCSNASGPITPHIARVPPRIPPCNNVCKEPSWHSPAVPRGASLTQGVIRLLMSDAKSRRDTALSQQRRVQLGSFILYAPCIT